MNNRLQNKKNYHYGARLLAYNIHTIKQNKSPYINITYIPQDL